jgi:hypothetical protein
MTAATRSDDVQEILARAAALAKDMAPADALAGLEKVTGVSVAAPSGLSAADLLAAAGWEPAAVRVRGGRVWTRGDAACVLAADGVVYLLS